MIEWFRPKKRKASHLEKIKIYICAYVYEKAEYGEDGINIELALPALRDIEYVTGINRQYVLEALNQLTEDDQENWLIRKGTHSRNTKFYINDWGSDYCHEKLYKFRDKYPELFYADEENPFHRKRTVTKEDREVENAYDTLPDFKKWKKK